MLPSSVVQTGVKSFGCENRMAQPSPIHSWKWIVPWVVSAVKSGATSLMRSDMIYFLFLLQIFFQNFVQRMTARFTAVPSDPDVLELFHPVKNPPGSLALGGFCAARTKVACYDSLIHTPTPG